MVWGFHCWQGCGQTTVWTVLDNVLAHVIADMNWHLEIIVSAHSERQLYCSSSNAIFKTLKELSLKEAFPLTNNFSSSIVSSLWNSIVKDMVYKDYWVWWMPCEIHTCKTRMRLYLNIILNAKINGNSKFKSLKSTTLKSTNRSSKATSISQWLIAVYGIYELILNCDFFFW